MYISHGLHIPYSKNSQTGERQVGISGFTRGMKTSEPGVEISLSWQH